MAIAYRYDYLLSALVSLDTLNSAAPITKLELMQKVSQANGPVNTVKVILLSDDLVLREALLTGEIQPNQADFAVLTPSVSESNTLTLPDYLMPDNTDDTQDNTYKAIDDIWARYFRYAFKTAKQAKSTFLKAWVGFEVGLRNALSTARADTLDLDVQPYLVTPDLGSNDMDFSGIITQWSSASDPLGAMEILDKARWAWLEEYGLWYSCKADEIEAYAAKLILMQRWQRLASE